MKNEFVFCLRKRGSQILKGFLKFSSVETEKKLNWKATNFLELIPDEPRNLNYVIAAKRTSSLISYRISVHKNLQWSWSPICRGVDKYYSETIPIK